MMISHSRFLSERQFRLPVVAFPKTEDTLVLVISKCLSDF